ncbi:uncharacterized protein LOC133035120 [Cannabis sativa]|uniref:uncharacterized protein LOC133035120 n=1 Tax=Cannabis sativa TaxID=3483 RepID=UPI0029CA093B|nr:uncharacterized protein LOC133035120 [Cannabis sativa]
MLYHLKQSLRHPSNYGMVVHLVYAIIGFGGCPAHVLRKKEGKLESRTEVCMFVGNSKETRGGLFYSHKDNKVFVSTNATFLEDNYMKDNKPKSEIVLEEMLTDTVPSNVPSSSTQEEDHPTPSVVATEKTTTKAPVQKVTTPRRSGRVSTKPSRYGLDGEINMVVGDGIDDDPLTYK